MAVLNPKPGFVVKTRVVASPNSHLLRRKVFINICSDLQVPKPEDAEFVPEVVFPKIVDSQWEIPIIVSSPKEDIDKKGVPSTVIDCCINSTCFTWIQLFSDLKKIVIEWCLEAIEVTNDVTLDRQYSLPKMLVKGELTRTEISDDELSKGVQARLDEMVQNEHLSLLEEIKSDDNGELPPLFPVSAPPTIEEVDHPRTGAVGHPRIEEVAPRIEEVAPRIEDGDHPRIEEVSSTPTIQMAANPIIEVVATTTSQPVKIDYDDIHTDPDDSDSSDSRQIDYQLSFTTLENQKFNTVVKLVSPQLTATNVSVFLQGMDLVISPQSPLFFSSKDRNLVIPVRAPKAMQPRCFFVGPEHTLYVFI